MANQSLLRNWP